MNAQVGNDDEVDGLVIADGPDGFRPTPGGAILLGRTSLILHDRFAPPLPFQSTAARRAESTVRHSVKRG